MKKILLITDDAFTYSGREKICDFMTTTFTDGKNSVDVFSLKGNSPSFYNYKGAREIRTFAKCKFPIVSLIKSLKKETYDYIFVVSMGKLSVLFSFFLFFIRNIGAKFIACEHVSLESLKPFIRFLKRIALRKYDSVVVLTHRDKENLYRWGINSVVIENPVDYKGIKKNRRLYKAIAVGRLNKQKNFSELIDIWSAFIINYPHWELHILGDGEERLELQRKIEKLQLNDRVFLQGKVRNIEDYYIDADVCLMTSLYEGLPMALLEAKSYSLPVIAYDCPTGPKEIIENGNDGYVIDMHDSKEFLNKLTYIATNDQAYFEFTRNTQKTCARFQSENIKNKWIKLIYR
ncbi:TPA: glycosyltransferase [Pluralibacter gergoviae]|uniref:Glycosyl transferase family 1 domain-containing protein n=2 Tax=Pluralibacter gergoviae TaxID=61647 RepID=A0A0J5LCQ8_PLUGE|nr:glycosyltransferase [Pluralibacter gergoviae]KMK16149.1 hypothetical protein ABW06_02745 [Pluralibacter gergoviae]KMK27380.1 hypothetical protein ABW10_02695 [Pluralibacter gergoviae]MCK1066687.1 glycosyltransferase [Pluralibacter gergoviae]MCV7759089.1 glycosyltransferase [Pluralibacter gergoviae]HDS1151431.1 glycosyltransferase [Pluralibacter gergoviae]